MPNREDVAKGLTYLIGTGLIILSTLLTGCPTAYRPENLTGGYSNFRMGDTTYRVRFKGNNYTTRDKGGIL